MELDIHELTAGYALDALDPADRAAFEYHLPGCERCQEELASFWDVTSALALGADPARPGAGLRERILAEARAERQTVVPLEPHRRRLVQPVLVSATAIAAAVAIGVGIYAISLHNQLSDTRSALTAQGRGAAVLADPTATTVSLQSGSGRLVVARGGTAVLVLDDLRAAPAGKTYQAWIVKGQTPVSAGIFQPVDGTAIVPIPQAVPGGAVVAVTVEKAGGAASPTLPPLAASNPV
jgi:anti-sigma factor RsiW